MFTNTNANQNVNKYKQKSMEILNEFCTCQAPTKVPPDDLHPDPSNINVYKHKYKSKCQQIQTKKYGNIK